MIHKHGIQPKASSRTQQFQDWRVPHHTGVHSTDREVSSQSDFEDKSFWRSDFLHNFSQVPLQPEIKTNVRVGSQTAIPGKNSFLVSPSPQTLQLKASESESDTEEEEGNVSEEVSEFEEEEDSEPEEERFRDNEPRRLSPHTRLNLIKRQSSVGGSLYSDETKTKIPLDAKGKEIRKRSGGGKPQAPPQDHRMDWVILKGACAVVATKLYLDAITSNAFLIYAENYLPNLSIVKKDEHKLFRTRRKSNLTNKDHNTGIKYAEKIHREFQVDYNPKDTMKSTLDKMYARHNARTY